eukprot:GHVS01101997.1.p1 GENE.GHVS01101997.1~~GHVS01101997.1.p1  ORF type:complete len:774 (-),score=103.87 GHVS01101997.1:165-2486(-)
MEAEVTGSHMYNNLRKLINVVDELRDVGLQQYINLPRICVVGTQSSGKSSVLESIMGLDFLPRGEGVVTRRPIELRLVHLSEAEHKLDAAWVVFDSARDKKFTNFEDVRRHIENLTDQVAGKNKGIIDDPIVLTVYATQCPDLSLIDLPGITRVPIKGSDQTDDIEKLTREMALRYAEDPRTIVLAVLPANADMSTSDALQIARRVDPNGLRTIGVITKLDIMDRGMDAAKMLLGEEVPLRLGYTGLVNRSQADIREGKSIQQAIQHEKEFFSSHGVYRALTPGLCGVGSLVDKLTKVLFRHIKNFLPEIKREISNKMRCVSGRLQELGEGVPVEVGDRVQLMWSMITDYCGIYKNTIRGKYDKRLQAYFENQDIAGGAHIRVIFNELLEEYVDAQVTKDMTDYDIDLAIRMHEGDALPGFPSPDTFEYLILPHLRKVHAPVLDTLDRVGQTLELLSQKIANRVFGRFPKLAEQVLELSQDILLQEKEATKVILENVVQLETGYLFTNDAKYLSEHGSMINNAEEEQQDQQGTAGTSSPTPPSQSVRGEKKARELFNHAKQSVSSLWTGQEKKKTRYSEQFLREIRRRLDSYFNIVLRNVRDTVPKAIGFFLVRQLEEKLQFQLYNELNNEQRFADLLGEPPHIMEERRSLSLQMNTLKKATQVLQRDPQIASLNLDKIDDSFDSDLKQSMQKPERAEVTNGVSHALPQAQGNATITTASPSSSPVRSPDPRKTSSGGLFDKPLPPTPAGSQKHLFEKEPAKRQVQTNPLFND